MIHIDDGVLRAYLDDELPASEAAAVRSHVLACPACAARRNELGHAAGVVSSALAVLPDGAPAPEAWMRVRASLSGAAEGGGTRARSVPGTPWMARAAGIVLLTGGGLAAALLPGSPLRSWFSADAPPVSAATGPATPAVAPADANPGIRSAVASDRAEVALTAPAGVEVAVYRAGDRAGVFGPADARFRVEGNRLHAESSTGPLRVELPPTVRHAEVLVNGVLRVEIRDGALVTAPEPLGGGPDLLVRFRVQ